MKKIIYIIVSVFILTATMGLWSVCNAAELVTDGENFYVFGDANGDGQIDTRDLVRMKKYSVGSINDISIIAADLDSDGKIKASDITALRQILLNGFIDIEENSDWSGIF